MFLSSLLFLLLASSAYGAPGFIVSIPPRNMRITYNTASEFFALPDEIVGLELSMGNWYTNHAENTIFEIETNPNDPNPSCEAIQGTGSADHLSCALESLPSLTQLAPGFILSFNATLNDTSFPGSSADCTDNGLRACAGAMFETEPFILFPGDQISIDYYFRSVAETNDNYYEMLFVIADAGTYEPIRALGRRGIDQLDPQNFGFGDFTVNETDGKEFIFRAYIAGFRFDELDPRLSVEGSITAIDLYSSIERTDRPSTSPTNSPTSAPTNAPTELICPPGRFRLGDECAPCDINTFTNVSGLTSCFDCPPYYHTNNTVGNMMCYAPTECPPGSTWELSIIQCIPCPVDTFSEVFGSLGNCTACPEGLSTGGTINNIACQPLEPTSAPSFSATYPPVASECSTIAAAALDTNRTAYALVLRDLIYADDFQAVDCLNQLYGSLLARTSEAEPLDKWGVAASDVLLDSMINVLDVPEPVQLGPRARILQYNYPTEPTETLIEVVCLCDSAEEPTCAKQFYFTSFSPVPPISDYFGFPQSWVLYDGGAPVVCSQDIATVEISKLPFGVRRRRQLQSGGGTPDPVYGSHGSDTTESPTSSPTMLPTTSPTLSTPSPTQQTTAAPSGAPIAVPTPLPTAATATSSPTSATVTSSPTVAVPVTSSPTAATTTTSSPSSATVTASPTRLPTTRQPTISSSLTRAPTAQDFVSSPAGIAVFVVAGVVLLGLFAFVVRKFYLIQQEKESINSLFDRESVLPKSARRFLFEDSDED